MARDYVKDNIQVAMPSLAAEILTPFVDDYLTKILSWKRKRKLLINWQLLSRLGRMGALRRSLTWPFFWASDEAALSHRKPIIWYYGGFCKLKNVNHIKKTGKQMKFDKIGKVGTAKNLL